MRGRQRAVYITYDMQVTKKRPILPIKYAGRKAYIYTLLQVGRKASF
jgi:hypothetical protein